MEISITKWISNELTSTVVPNDRLSQITNLFFITAPILYVIGKSLFHRFSPPDTSQLTSSEKIKIRSLIEKKKFEEAKKALLGKNDPDLWSRLILCSSNLSDIPTGLDCIAAAPENIKRKLYEELTIYAVVNGQLEVAYNILAEAALLQKPQVKILSSFYSQQTSVRDQVDYFLDLAEEYRTFHFSLKEDLSKCFWKPKGSQSIDSTTSHEEQYQCLQQLKKNLRERSRRQGNWIQSVSAIQNILTDDSKVNGYIKNEKENKKTIDKLLNQFEQPDILKTFQVHDWENAEYTITPLLQWKDFLSFDPTELIGQAMKAAERLPENTSKELEEKSFSYLKIFKYLKQIDDPRTIDTFHEQMEPFYQRFLETQLISSIDRIDLCVKVSQWLPDSSKNYYFNKACSLASIYDALSEDKDLRKFKSLIHLIEEMIKYSSNINKIDNVVLHAIEPLMNYSPENETDLNNMLNHFCCLVELGAKVTKITNEDFTNQLAEIRCIILTTTILNPIPPGIYLKIASAYYNINNQIISEEYHQLALNAAKFLPDPDNRGSLVSFFSSTSNMWEESQFDVLRKIYLQCTEQNNVTIANESRCAMATVATHSNITIVKRINYYLEIAKMYFGNTPMDSSPKGIPERTYPVTGFNSEKLAVQFLGSAIQFTSQDEFKKLPLRYQVWHFEQLIKVSEHFGERQKSIDLLNQVVKIAKEIPDPKTETESQKSASSTNSSISDFKENKYQVYIRLYQIAKELEIDSIALGIIESISNIQSHEQVDRQIQHLCNAAEKIHAFMKKDAPNSQYLTPIFNKISSLLVQLYPTKPPISIYEVQKYVSALGMFYTTQNKVNFVPADLNDKRPFTALTLLIDSLPLSKGNFLSSSSQVKEITELKVRLIHLINEKKEKTEIVSDAILKAKAYPKTEDQFEAMSLLAPLAYSLGLYDPHRQFILSNIDKNPEKVMELVITVAPKLAEMATNLPKNTPNYEDSFNTLEKSLKYLFGYFIVEINKSIPRQQEEIYRKFTQCLFTFPTLQLKYKENLQNSWYNTLQHIPPSLEKKRLVEAFAETMFKFNTHINGDLMTKIIDECNEQINNKELVITLTSYARLWALARILFAPSEDLYHKIGWLSVVAAESKLTNASVNKCYP